MFRKAVAASIVLDIAYATVRISTIGDSITAGVCSGPETRGYPDVLQQILGSGYTVSNFGNSGKNMLKNGICGPPASGNCSYWGTPSWPQALASTPDIVTIALGTNDAKRFNWYNQSQGVGPCDGVPTPACPTGWYPAGTTGNYTADYIDMIHQLQALNPKPLVFVIIPPPLYPPFPYDMDPTVINEVLPALIPKIAQAAGAEPTILSAFAACGGADLSDPGITCDGCHPIDWGYVSIAQAIAPAIKAAVSEGRLTRNKTKEW